MVKIELDRARRTITFRASGIVTIPELQQTLREAKQATDAFKGGQHIVFADLRGLVPMSPEASEVFGELIRYGREHGTALCIHMSDSSIASLQANRLARQVTPNDATTINVVSLEEAKRVIEERHATMVGPALG